MAAEYIDARYEPSYPKDSSFYIPLELRLSRAFVDGWMSHGNSQNPWVQDLKYTALRENSSLDPFSQNVVHTLEAFGQILPKCGTLRAVARDTLSHNGFDPERAMKIFNNFQNRAHRNGHAVLLYHRDISSAMTQALGMIKQAHGGSAEELQGLQAFIHTLPPILFDSLDSGDDGGGGYPIDDGVVIEPPYEDDDLILVPI